MFAVIRIRGELNLSPQIKENLRLLKLSRLNHLVLVKESNECKGMLDKAKDYVTYGEISAENLAKLISKRGRVAGDKRITEEALKKCKLKNFEALAKEIEEGKKIEDFGIKPVFRLNPPSKGFERKGIKKTFKEGGALGYRGKEINELLLRMI